MLRRLYVLLREAYGRLLRVPGLGRPARLGMRGIKRAARPAKPVLRRVLAGTERAPPASALADRLAAAEREIALLRIRQRITLDCLDAIAGRNGDGRPPS